MSHVARRHAGLRLGTLLVMLCVARIALAGNGISAITLRVERQLTSVALRAIVTGDDDSSAVLRIFQRWNGAGPYDTGMVMVRRVGYGPTGRSAPATGNVYEGRILWLTPGKLVQYYIEGEDAGGGLTTPADTVSCTRIRRAITSGPIFYVDAASGNDEHEGTRSRPKRTINAALAALSGSPRHGRNGGIVLAPGEYHERVNLDSSRFPTDGDHHFLEGDGTNPDSTILCGAHPLLEHGLYAPGKPLQWTFTGQDSTWKCHLPARGGPADSIQLVVLGWGELLHRKTSLRAVLDDSTFAHSPASPAGIGSGELSGWYWQNDTLYLKRKSGKSPSGEELHVGYLNELLTIGRRNWRIANLTFRFAGGTESSNGAYRAWVNPSVFGKGIVAGGHFGAASGTVVDSCRFYGFNSLALYFIPSFNGLLRVDSCVVAHSVFDGLTLGGMNYGAAKSRIEENAGGIVMRGCASSFISNTVRDLHNGISTGNGAADSLAGSQFEIVHNRFTKMSDDAIELDTGHNINTLVAGNHIELAGSGLSIAPVLTGPVFVFYNTITNSLARGVKGSNDSKGIAHFVHNTIASAVPGSTAVDFGSGGGHDGTMFVNNVLIGNAEAIVVGPRRGGERSNSFNYDLLESLLGARVVAWADEGFTLPELRTALGWERNGVSAGSSPADPLRVKRWWDDLRPAVDAGRRWTGVNTGLDGPRYTGAAPDIGAREQVPR